MAGALVERFPELGSALDRWAKDADFWVRRSAILALLDPLRRGEGDFDRFSRYADAMLCEKEFFIRKAIGWTLREVSKRRPRPRLQLDGAKDPSNRGRRGCVKRSSTCPRTSATNSWQRTGGNGRRPGVEPERSRPLRPGSRARIASLVGARDPPGPLHDVILVE